MKPFLACTNYLMIFLSLRNPHCSKEIESNNTFFNPFVEIFLNSLKKDGLSFLG
jgi:hypothetical protein